MVQVEADASCRSRRLPAAGCCRLSARADVKLANLFTEHAVLQQGVNVPVWGTAEANEQVTVSVAGQSATATADANGKWVAQAARARRPAGRTSWSSRARTR